MRKLNIYVSHSSKMNFEDELYKVLQNSNIGIYHNLILPHSKEYIDVDTKNIIMTSDLLIAEVTYPGTGIGLELGRAECSGVPIVCIVKDGIECSSSIKRNFDIIEYKDGDDMIKKLEEYIKTNIY
jgi:hypothetical protein